MGTPTCLVVDPGQPLSVQSSTVSAEKSSRSLLETKCLKLTQDDTSITSHLTVQDFLFGLRKPTTSPCKPPEADRATTFQPFASTGHKDLLFGDLEATYPGPGLLDPPESSPSETDGDQLPSPALEARRLRSLQSPGADERDVTMEIPKVVRTYTKKPKHNAQKRKDSYTLFLTQSSTHEETLLDGPLDDGSDIPKKRLAPKVKPKIGPVKKLSRAAPCKRKRQTLQHDEKTYPKGGSEDNADTVISEKKRRTKRKKRRAPVNELALVTALPVRRFSAKAYGSDNAIDLISEILDEEESSTSVPPACDKSRKPTRANVGRPRKKPNQDISILQRDVLAREGFKVPPFTPRPTKAPGWKLGSGFDGITLRPSANRKPRNRNITSSRDSIFSGRSFPELELSTTMSSTRQPAGQRSIPKSQKNQPGLVAADNTKPVPELATADSTIRFGLPRMRTKTRENPAFVQVASSTALCETMETEQLETVSSSNDDGTVRKPVPLHSSQNMYLGPSQSIREPLRSEHSGWLKRQTVKFVTSDKGEDEHILFRTPITSVIATGYSEDITQSQHATDKDPQAFIEGGRIRPVSDLPVTPSQKRDICHKEPSVNQYRRQVLHDAIIDSSPSDEGIIGGQRSSRPLKLPLSLHSKVSSSMHPRNLPMPKARRHIEGSKKL